ncbi:MAG: hypothetical protein M3503_05000 [Actinomycetota bacterium]|nr:hypothetical protein [Actinomycetota bacterium]
MRCGSPPGPPSSWSATGDVVRSGAGTLGRQPWEITRTGEAAAAGLGLAELPLDRDAWLEVLVANPVLVERPILVTDDGRAALGRPPEGIIELL